MTEASQLQTYVVGIFYDEGWHDDTLVAATSLEQAVRLAHPEFDEVEVSLALEGDEWSVECLGKLWDGEPRVLDRSVATFRAAGLHFADEHQCEGCEEWSEGVCEDCNLCSVCAAGEKPEWRCPDCEVNPC